MPHLVNVLLMVWMHFNLFFWWRGEEGDRWGACFALLIFLDNLIYHSLRFKITTQVKSFSIFSFVVSPWSIIWCVLQWINYYPFTQGEHIIFRMLFRRFCKSHPLTQAVCPPWQDALLSGGTYKGVPLLHGLKVTMAGISEHAALDKL